MGAGTRCALSETVVTLDIFSSRQRRARRREHCRRRQQHTARGRERAGWRWRRCAARAVERQPFRAALQALPVTALLTYGGTLWACAALFVAEGPHGGVHRFVIFANISLSGPVNFTAAWQDCLCGEPVRH